MNAILPFSTENIYPNNIVIEEKKTDINNDMSSYVQVKQNKLHDLHVHFY